MKLPRPSRIVGLAGFVALPASPAWADPLYNATALTNPGNPQPMTGREIPCILSPSSFGFIRTRLASSSSPSTAPRSASTRLIGAVRTTPAEPEPSDG